MIVVTVTEPDGAFYTRIFEKDEITLGRTGQNDLVLPDGNVSQRHARISHRDGKFIVADTGSTNGVYVNGRMASGPMVVTGPNKIHVAGFILTVSELRAR